MLTRVGVPFVLVVRADLLAHKLLIDDFFELDHCGGGINEVIRGFRVCDGVVEVVGRRRLMMEDAVGELEEVR